jgi:hypothetical protein
MPNRPDPEEKPGPKEFLEDFLACGRLFLNLPRHGA